jgi:hypothetical protein
LGRDQRIVDELKRFGRLCLELADGNMMPEERAGLLEMACNYRAEIVDRERANRFADTAQTRDFFDKLRFSLKSLILLVSALGLEPRTP